MESITPSTFQKEDEISLKDVILKIQEWIKFLWKKRLLILICTLIGGGLGFLYAFNKKTLYIAELTFVLEDSKSNPFGAYAGLASQFGIDLGGGPSSGIFSGDNILEFLRSRLMVEKALLSPIIYQDKSQSLADYYVEINELRETWKNKPQLQNLHFPVNANRINFTLQQDSILNTVYTKIVKKHLSITKPDKKLSFISVECTTQDEIFSKIFTERLVKEATDFYIQTKTKRTKTAVDKLQIKADSIESLLNRKTYSAAASQDLNLNPARSMAGVGTELVTRDKMVLQTMYAEVVRNLELTRMAMNQETPVIQIVDTPILPLKAEKFGKIKGIILGGFLGGFLIVLWLLIRRIYKEILAQ